MSTTSDTRMLTRGYHDIPSTTQSEVASTSCGSCVNVGKAERQVSLAAGAIAAAAGLARRDIPGLLIAAVGAGLIYRGATGHCHAYDALGLDTCADGDGSRGRIGRQQKSAGFRISKSILVDKRPNELYAFWRKLENLPTIMSHLESVQIIDEKRSHWVASAPAVVGGAVEWDAEMIDDQPGERIAWRSLPESGIANRGSVEFEKAPGDRGTYIHLEMEYAPPAGKLGNMLANLLGNNPESQIREDLRRFKRSMEMGDVLTTEGQPRGSCVAGIGRLMT